MCGLQHYTLVPCSWTQGYTQYEGKNTDKCRLLPTIALEINVFVILFESSSVSHEWGRLHKWYANSYSQDQSWRDAVIKTFTSVEAETALPVCRFIQALEKSMKAIEPVVIAEIKKVLSSSGDTCEHFDSVTIAVEYTKHGASCSSVLTDKKYFQGSLDYIQAVWDVCTLSILCKNFIIDPYEVYEAQLAGADCILLIVAVLSDHKLWIYHHR